MSDQTSRRIDILLPEYSSKARNLVLEILRGDLTRLGVPDLKSPEDYRSYLATLERALKGEVVIPGYSKQVSIRVAGEIYPKVRLFYVLVSPVQTEDDPVLRDKTLTKSISNIRKFVRELWPRRRKKGRMIETYMDWLNPEDEGEMLRDKVWLKKEER